MLLAAMLIQATAAAPVFAPPLDAPLRVVTERVDTGASERRFRLERLVRFAHEERGYRAEVVILTVASDTPEATGALYEAGFGSLIGRTLVFHIDAAGKVVSVDGMADIWESLCHGVAANAASRRALPPAERAALAKRIAGPLLALPADRQRSLLGSLVAPLISDETGEPAGIKPVRIPGATPLGDAVMLEGQRTLAATGNAQMRSLTRAAAETHVPAEGSAPARIGRIDIETQREFDPRTGLVAQSIDTTIRRLGSGAEARETRRVTTIRATPVPPESWPHN
jgi:hypothetical protein